MIAIPRVKNPQGIETKLPARIESYKTQKVDPPLPPVTARHIYDWLMEVGPVLYGEAGQASVTWTAIRDWSALTFTRLSAWEARLLRRLSAEYLTETHAAEDHTRPAPWSPGRSEITAADALRQLKSVLG